jgi:alkaline phosphatase D
MLDINEFYFRTEGARINQDLKPFYHGVASGDPLQNSVIIWTRVTPDDFNSTVEVDWYVSENISFTNVVQSGKVNTSSSRDFTVKVDVKNLEPGKYYYYLFKALGSYSVVGRTKTAPASGINRMRIGAVTCSDYRAGYFQAYEAMSKRNDLDIILHMGDYIYEGGGGPAERKHDPDFEIYTLAHYRTRYSQYRLDTMLQKCHQVHPFMTIWDDHDIVVDALRDTSFRHNPAFGSYQNRKLAAITAAREWLPIRDPEDGGDIYKNWRNVSWGDLAEIIMIDVRLYDRDRFAANTSDTIYGKSDHRMMGPEQLRWFNETIKNTRSTWKITGNQLMFSHFGILGIPFVLENWDGYPYERNQIFNNLESNKINNLVFLTGDFHCSFANDVPRNPNNPFQYNRANGRGSLAVEFVLPSISGGNLDEEFGGLDVLPPGFVEGGAQFINPHSKFIDLTEHGYVLLDVTKQRAQAEFWFQESIRQPGSVSERPGAIWYTINGENRLRKGNQISTPIDGIPIPPPYTPFEGNVNTNVQNQVATILGVYPNPFKNELAIHFNINQLSIVSIYLSDMQGKLVRMIQSPQQMNTGNYINYAVLDELPAGNYILTIASNEGNKSVMIARQ